MFRNITFTVYDVKICEDSLSNSSPTFVPPISEWKLPAAAKEESVG